MIYSFDSKIAEMYGVNEAIFINNIYFWVKKNEANGKNCFEGQYWTYNTLDAYSRLFPFWTVNQIRRIIEKLRKAEVIKIGNFNKLGFDRTRWYTLGKSAFSFCDFCQTDLANLPNGTGKNYTTIPDIKTQIVNTDSKPDREGTNRKRFSPPAIDEIKKYCSERKNTVEPNRFYDFYQSKNWMVGKNKMTDWKAAVRNWERSEKKESGEKNYDGDFFRDAFENIIAVCERENQPQEGDYYEDNLLMCGKCNTKKQTIIQLFGEPRKVFIACECRVKAYEDEKKERKIIDVKRRIDELRKSGIAETDRRGWRFESDNGSNQKIMKTCRRYVEKWEEVKKENIGLLMYGGVGTGKSFAACCIANDLIDRGISALVTSLPKCISAGFQSNILDDIEHAELLVLDDIGVERETSFALEKVFEIIDTRIKSGKPLIVTTNLSPEDFRRQDIEYKRIYDRILGVCTPIKFTGESIRRGQALDRAAKAKQILGG